MSISDKFKLENLLVDNDKGSAQALIVAGDVKTRVQNERAVRKVNIDKNWNLYQGDHAQYFKQRNNEDNKVYQSRKNNATILNFVAFIVDLGAKFAYGRPEKVRRQYSKDQDDNKTENGMRRLERLIGIQEFMLNTKRMCGIFSEQVIRFIPIDERTGEQVFSTDTVTATTYPYPVKLDSAHTFALRNQWGKLNAVVIEDSFKDYSNNKITNTMELVVNDTRWMWHDGILKSSGKNKYALNEEFVLFVNNDMRRDDFERISNLQIKLDEAWTDAAHFFEKHGWPQMVSKQDLKNVLQGPAFVWQINPENENAKIKDEIDFLTWDGKIQEALEYLDKIESAILKLSSTAAIATGDLKKIGNISSGAGIVTTYGVSIQNATEKQVIWDRNEVGFFNSLAAFDARIHGESVDKRYPNLEPSVTFPDDFVPGEELVRSEIDAMLLGAHAVPLRDILRRRHPTYSEERITELREEIFDDSEKLTDIKNFSVSQKIGENQPISSGKKKSNEQPKELINRP